MKVPPLETTRLIVRSFVRDDLEAIYRILDREIDGTAATPESLAERKSWLEWTVLNYQQLDRLIQPPYGDRAVVLKATQELIGACGYVPCLDAFGQLSAWRSTADSGPAIPASGVAYATPAFGLYWAIAPSHRQKGYATEAARALIDFAFQHLRLERIVATTTYDNLASQGVMRKLGMRLETNPLPQPPWLQVVGMLDHP